MSDRRERTIEPDTDQGFLPFADRLAEFDDVVGIQARPDDQAADGTMAIVGVEDERTARRVESEAGARGLEPGQRFEGDGMVGVPVRDPQRQQSDEAFFDVGTGAFGTDLRPVEIERQQPTGKFAPPNVEAAPDAPADRGPDGKFVSPRREPLDDIGRRENDGLFDLF